METVAVRAKRHFSDGTVFFCTPPEKMSQHVFPIEPRGSTIMLVVDKVGLHRERGRLFFSCGGLPFEKAGRVTATVLDDLAACNLESRDRSANSLRMVRTDRTVPSCW